MQRVEISPVVWQYQGLFPSSKSFRELVELLEQVVSLDLKESSALTRPSSDVFVVRCTNGHYDGLRRLIGLMAEHGLHFYKSAKTIANLSPKGLIAVDDVVLIKVNSQWDERGGTNTDLLKSLIQSILAHPDGFTGEIVVADNGQAQAGSQRTGGNLDWEKSNAEDSSQSVQSVVEAFSGGARVSSYLWDAITTTRVKEYFEGDIEDGFVIKDTSDPVTGIKVSYPKFKTGFGTHISFKMGVWDNARRCYVKEGLKVISVPVLKPHFIYGVSACVKHYMGVVSDKLTEGRSHRSVGTGGMGTVLAETRMPDLNVLDCIWVNANPGKGPRSPYAEATGLNMVLASKDPFALDYWAAKHILIQAAKTREHHDLTAIDPDNVKDRAFGNWLRLALKEVQKAGHSFTTDEDQISVFISDAR